jgi:nucleoid-associated protein YgaU
MGKSYWWLLGGAAVVLLGLLLWWQGQPGPEPEEAPVAEAEVKPATEPAPEPEVKPESEPTVTKAEAPAPVFDVVRVSPDGQTVIAGHAEPGQTVEVLLDGAVIGSSVAGSDGAFATVLEVPPSGEARELVLRVPSDVGGETVVALAPGGQTAAQGASGDEAASQAPAVTSIGQTEGEAQAEAQGAGAEATTAVNTQSAAQMATTETGAEGTASVEAASSGALTTTTVAAPAATEMAGSTEAPPAEAPAEGARLEPSKFAVSSPVIILPQKDTETAPVLVKPEAEDVKLLQPAAIEPGTGIALDRITYSSHGDLIAAGRGEPGTVVRVYVNAEFLTEVRCNEGGRWRVEIGSDVAAKAQLLRFDAIDATGKVVRRLETPFEYSPSTATHEVRERKIEVQSGDYLWKFAEQYYGQGWRYSVIFSANSALIRDPDLIYPGQVFTIPELVNSQ